MNPRYRYTGLVIALLIVAFSSWKMLNTALWGHLPLFWFIGLWAALVLLFQKLCFSNLRYLALSTAAGILLSLGFPPIPLTFLMFVGFMPLLLIEEELEQSSEASRKASLFAYTYHGIVVWNILTTFWVANTAFMAGVFAILLNTLFMCAPFVLYHQFKKWGLAKYGGLPFIALWLSFEHLHLSWDLSWPWLTLGNAFSQFPSWVQWYEYTGVFGGSLWILLGNFLALDLYKRWKSGQSLSWLKVVLLLLPIPISIGIYHNTEDKGAASEVVLIQPNYEPHYQKFTVPYRQQLDQFTRLSKAAIDDDTDYLVFPETSFFRIRTNQLEQNPAIRALDNLVQQYPNLHLITGLGTHNILTEEEAQGKSVRTAKNGKETIYFNTHNTAVQISSHQDTVPLYYKSKLVPGAEIFPYPKLFFMFDPIVKKLGGSLSPWTTQPERSVFEGRPWKVAPVICYESIYGDFCNGYVRKGANALFIVTNDGWWDLTPGHLQHLKLGRLRAIETRRSIARAANTGISCFINQRGDITMATAYEEEAYVKGDIMMNDEITFYVIYGDIIARIAVFLFFAFGLMALVKRLSRNNLAK